MRLKIASITSSVSKAECSPRRLFCSRGSASRDFRSNLPRDAEMAGARAASTRPGDPASTPDFVALGFISAWDSVFLECLEGHGNPVFHKSNLQPWFQWTLCRRLVESWPVPLHGVTAKSVGRFWRVWVET